MKKRILISVFSCLCALWIGFIWINSMQVGSVSGEMSGSVTESINAFFRRFWDGFYISGYAVRKLAHFSEFALLSFFISLDVYYIFGISKRSSLKKSSLVLAAFPISFAVACIDESIQLFVEGRVGSIIDVLIDSSGALVSVTLFLCVLLLRKKLSKDTHTAT
jgi:VanZ family protein